MRRERCAARALKEEGEGGGGGVGAVRSAGHKTKVLVTDCPSANTGVYSVSYKLNTQWQRSFTCL